MRVFFRVRPGTTLGVVTATAAASIARLLSFFLPIKVILLAASPGVPRYFPFIDPAEKMPWVVGLSISCFVFYGLTLFLEARVRRWSEGASVDVLQGANEMAVQSDQHERAQLAYSGLCGASASVLFMCVGSLALLFLNPLLLGVLTALILFEYGLSAWFVRGCEEGVRAGTIKRWIMERAPTYLSILGSLTTLLGFLVILLPFVTGGEGNVLIAILSFLIMRQSVGAVREFAGDGVRLLGRREQIDALVFPDAQRAVREAPYQRDLRDVFSRQERCRLAAAAVHQALDASARVYALWTDSPKNFVQTLGLVVDGQQEGRPCRRHLQMQVFRSTRRMYLENEDFLFRHVRPSELYAPARFGRWSAAPFEYQILEYGEGRAMTGAEWKTHGETLIQAMLGCEPPPRLVDAYRRSHRLMPERLLDDRLVQRLEIAIDSDEEAAWLETYRESVRRQVADALRALPLALDNRDLGPATCGITEDRQPLSMIWGRWTLEPFGAGRLILGEKVDVEAWIPGLADKRPSLGEDALTSERLQIARLSGELEAADAAGNYKAAVNLVGDLVALLTEGDCSAAQKKRSALR